MRAPDFIIGPPADPYLERWWVIPRNKWFNIYLHHFLHSDEDRALHDHPWLNLSVILRGKYIEHIEGGRAVVRHRFRPVFRRSVTAHRIELFAGAGGLIPVWTLFITGPRIREWGFLCPAGWKHWTLFTKAGSPGQVGPGCDD